MKTFSFKYGIVITVLVVLPLVLMFTTVSAAGPTAFDQCQTGSPPTGGCKWVTGILNPGANTYLEGMATPQRALYAGLTGTSHTLTFEMQWTKAGLHAYDWPVSWQQAEKLAQSIGHYSLSIYPSRCADLNPGDTRDCNLATIPQTANVPTDPYVSGQFGLPATDGSTANKIAAFVPVYGTPQIQIYSNAPITFTVAAPTHSVANNADTGDSTVKYTIQVTGSATILQLVFAAHIAISDAPGDPAAPGTTWGQGFGAKNISGAPYHVNTMCIDGSCSSQDNQLNLNGTPFSPSLVTQISNTTRTLGQPVSDTVTMSFSKSTILSGTLDFYVCGPTASPQPCLPQYNFPQYGITKTTAGSINVNTTASSLTRSSLNFTPPAIGTYCFLVQWINQDFNSQSWESFVTTNECVSYSNPTAVALSSFDTKGTSSNALPLLAGLAVGMLAFAGAGFALFHKRLKTALNS